MKTKVQKKETIDKLSQKIPVAGVVVFTSFSREGEKGLSVAQMRNLKKALRGMGAEYFVAKKNLINISTKNSGMSDLVDVSKFDGSVGLAIGGKELDSIALSKSVYDFSRANPVFRIFGAVVENKYLDADSFKDFARLGSKEMLVARLFGMMQYPMRNLLLVLNNIKK
ncbi:MAG: 50S ribosomal protein L10 [Candidatus Yanofskybacteria bacterium]|nr:50S ribosomal protein L10 [Candidatus Yanofskybacteria bacterium]